MGYLSMGEDNGGSIFKALLFCAIPPGIRTWLSHATQALSLPHGLVAQPASITLVKAFLEGRLQLQGAGDDRSDALAGLLSLHERQSVPTGDGSIVEHHTWEM